VIIPKTDVVVVQNMVHVTGHRGHGNNMPEFPVAMRGSADRSDLEFATAEECNERNKARKQLQLNL
jgi:hypothetical protein